MKTTTGQDILNQAAELAQRTRDKIPPQEQTLLQGFVATEFQMLVNSQPWPELIPALFNVTAASRQFSKNEGSADPVVPEMGDILWLGTHNPQTDPCYRKHAVAFYEGDGVVFVETDRTDLWVEYMLPYPGVRFADMTPGVMTLANFFAATLPLRFRNILAHKAAGHLLNSDGGNAAAAGVQYGLSNAVLVSEINRLPPTPYWRNTVRLAHPRHHRHLGAVPCA